MDKATDPAPILRSAFSSSWPVRYGGALLAVVIALAVWFLTPWMHQDSFAIYILAILAVVVCARFLGFSPAVLCTSLSVLIIDYLVIQPRLSFALAARDAARLVMFVSISLLAANLARQKSRAQVLVGETHQKMAAIVESSEDAIYSTRLDGIITSWNHGAENLYGYSAHEVLGQPISKMFPGDRLHEIPSSTQRLLQGERIPSHQTERLRKDGSRVTIQLSLSPVRDGRGQVVGVSAIARDITAQQRAEEALRRNEKLAAAGRLTAALAHEINNPLEAVTNLLYLARNDPSRADMHLRMAEREVLRVADIAQLTLGFVRDASSAVRLRVSPILEEVLERNAGRLSAKSIRVEKALSSRDQVYGFPTELRQLFSNLIANAIEAMPDGGRLRLHVTDTAERNQGGRTGIRVTVADTGAGIRPEDRHRIFEPFFTTRKNSGTGLGLWIAERVVVKHAGWIRTSTRPGQSGTAFMVFLPERPPGSSAEPELVPDSAARPEPLPARR